MGVINGHRVIDFGGVHGAERASVDLDAVAASLGITPCGISTLDLFFTERHTAASQFRVETTRYLQPVQSTDRGSADFPVRMVRSRPLSVPPFSAREGRPPGSGGGAPPAVIR
ncbi:MAG: hypothetical protein JXB32_20555 [Deltaproteobacteria bacterium]|nr:hypothetical protein [Deltaproteobacteria bacterium]